jgi:hypothetical protein
VIDLSLSSDEENFIADTSRDAEFARKLFSDLNCDILRLPGDDMVIILDDSDEEKEASDEKTVGTELRLLLLLSTRRQLPPPLPMMPLRGRKTIIVMIRGPIRRPVATTTMEVVTVRFRPPRRRPNR